VLFNSVIFLLVFLPLALLGWYGLRSTKLRLLFLTLMSFVFYAFWDWRFLGLMLASIFVDYAVGQQIARHNDVNRKKAKRWLWVSLASNLGMLAFFKYFNFFVDSLNFVLPPDGEIKSALEVVLPVGISFYTFQSMSYSLDIYQRKAQPAQSMLHFSAYVAMFPQLIAGPIVHYKKLHHQLQDLKRAINWEQFYDGVYLFVFGLARKLFIADFFAAQADLYFGQGYEVQFIGAWVAVLCYTIQIYFDFSAYSEMAIGLGKMLGFEFPTNFNSPYKARSFSDFWRRWHITLSKFLRDYLYIPLGGNRKGKTRTMVNLMITMLLGGLWHGATWMFVIWGAIHGVFLALERVIKEQANLDLGKLKLWRWAVFIGVCFAWVFFRAETMDSALFTLKAMCGLEGFETFDLTYNFHGIPLPEFVRYNGGVKLFAGLAIALLGMQVLPNTQQVKPRRKTWFAVLLALILLICLLYVDKPSPFIYFQF